MVLLLTSMEGYIMSGKQITQQQKRLYMKQRNQGDTQKVAAAKASFSIRSAKRIDTDKHLVTKKLETGKNSPRDPLKDVWDDELVPLLEKQPTLQAITLLSCLQDTYPGKYPDSILRTIQRRVREWKGIYGPEKEVIFRQNHPPGWQGLSDFTNCDKLRVTINGEDFPHLLYHFWMAFSTWEYVFVITGGESYTALAEGLQGALWALGGVPQTHRTDSLSAAYKNLSKNAQEDFTKAYEEFCKHYAMEATRNNKGVSHENGSVESSHRHLKTRIDQALMIKGSRNFDSLEEYRQFVDELASRHNTGIQHLLKEERTYLNPLPKHKTQEFDVEHVRVATTSTIAIRQVRYSVPSKLIGMQLKVHLYDDRIECFLGSTKVICFKRLRWSKGKRLHSINYRHVIGSLIRKPQAFRNYIYQDDLFPNQVFRETWEWLDRELDDRTACREYVVILKSAVDDEVAVSLHLKKCIKKNSLPKAAEIEKLFSNNQTPKTAEVEIDSRDLESYNQLLTF